MVFVLFWMSLRVRAKINSHSGITSSHHLWPLLNREILDVALLRLRFHSIVVAKSGANLRANSVNLFWREPLEPNNESTYCKYFPRRPLMAGNGSSPNRCQVPFWAKKQSHRCSLRTSASLHNRSRNHADSLLNSCNGTFWMDRQRCPLRSVTRQSLLMPNPVVEGL